MKELEDYKAENKRAKNNVRTTAQCNYYYRKELKKEMEKETKNAERINKLINAIESNGSKFDVDLIEEAKTFL